MSGPTPTYATPKDGQPERREQVNPGNDILAELRRILDHSSLTSMLPGIVLHEFTAMIKMIVEQAAEIEQGRIAREQWSQDQTEQEQTIARLTDQLKFCREQLKAEIQNSKTTLDQIARKQSCAASRHEEEMVKLFREIEDLKESRSAISADLKKAWRELADLENQRDGLQKVVGDFSKITDFMSRRKGTIAGGFVPDLVIALIQNLEDERDALDDLINNNTKTRIKWGDDVDFLNRRVSELYRVIDRQQSTIKSGTIERDALRTQVADLTRQLIQSTDDKKSHWAAIKDQEQNIVGMIREIETQKKTITEQAKEIERLKSHHAQWCGPENNFPESGIYVCGGCHLETQSNYRIDKCLRCGSYAVWNKKSEES